MAKKETKNLNNVPMAELEKELAEERQKLVDLKFNLAAGKVKNIKEVKKTKVRIAQILTAKNARKEN
jgi:ribosomal protein L29